MFVGGLIWAGYKIGYCHFYSLRIGLEQKVVACYLWPKGEIEIPAKEIESIAVIKIGFGLGASDVLVIKTKAGKDFVSTAPVPDPEVLPNRIREAIGVKTSKEDNK